MAAPRKIPPVRSSPEEAAAKRESEPIGKLLLEAGKITRADLDQALVAQRKTFRPIGLILREQMGLAPDALAAALRKQPHSPRVYLRFFPVPREVIGMLEADFCRQHEAVAFEKLGKMLCVALSNPAQRTVIRHIETVTSMEVKVFQAPWEDIQKKLTQ